MHPIRQQLRDRRHRTTAATRLSPVVQWDGHHGHTSFFRQWVHDTVCAGYPAPPLCIVGPGRGTRQPAFMEAIEPVGFSDQLRRERGSTGKLP